MKGIQDGAIAESRPDPFDESFARSQGDEDESPEDHEVSPPGRFTNHPALTQDKDHNRLDSFTDPVETVFLGTQEEDFDEAVGHVAEHSQCT